MLQARAYSRRRGPVGVAGGVATAGAHGASTGSPG